jgi:hypothetical protein
MCGMSDYVLTPFGPSGLRVVVSDHVPSDEVLAVSVITGEDGLQRLSAAKVVNVTAR